MLTMDDWEEHHTASSEGHQPRTYCSHCLGTGRGDTLGSEHQCEFADHQIPRKGPWQATISIDTTADCPLKYMVNGDGRIVGELQYEQRWPL